MATKHSFFSIFLSFVCLFHGCFGQQPQQQQGQCLLQEMKALEPVAQLQAEAGRTEFWNHEDQQFSCAGVALLRHFIQTRGFLLPSYDNAAMLVYVEKGRGFYGLMIPGCPETFQSSQSQFDRRQRFQDIHQKIENFQQGDIVAIPAGSAHWVYNNGNEELVVVVLQDTTNNINQLDTEPRRFFLAGNPIREPRQKGQQKWGNVFQGMDVETLAEAFNVNREIASRLQNLDDRRGHIIRIRDGLEVIRPPFTTGEEQQQYGGQGMNGLEETICTARFKENIDSPSRADVYNRQAGRFATINSFTFPILKFFQLSAERGVLHRNAMFSPHWYVNANGVMYVTRGDARVQIADHRGQIVFDGQLSQGQIVVVPMNFVVVKQAGNQGFEWVGFNTNDNAMINPIAGRTSTFRGLPTSVLAISLQISENEARQLKGNRQETFLFSPGSES